MTTTTRPPLPPKTIAVTTTPCLPSCPLLHRAFVIYLFSVCVACCVCVFFLLFRLTVAALSALFLFAGGLASVFASLAHTHRSGVVGMLVIVCIECSYIVALGSTILAPRCCVAEIQSFFRMHFVDIPKIVLMIVVEWSQDCMQFVHRLRIICMHLHTFIASLFWQRIHLASLYSFQERIHLAHASNERRKWNPHIVSSQNAEKPKKDTDQP